MPMPQEYFAASRDFDAFMEDAKQALGHQSHHQTYTTVEAVLTVFRRRVSVADGLRFADALPPVLRAIFVAGWDPDVPLRPFTSRAEMDAEAKTIRQHHNFAPDGAILTVAQVLRRHVDADRFARMLASLPEPARAFWAIDDTRQNAPKARAE